MFCVKNKEKYPRIIPVTTSYLELRPRGYKTYICSIQLGMKFFRLINVKMSTIFNNKHFNI